MDNNQTDRVFEIIGKSCDALVAKINDNNRPHIQCALQSLRDLKTDLHRAFCQEENSTAYRSHIERLNLVQNNLNLLHDAKDEVPTGSKLNGVIGNLIGLAFNLKQELQRPDLKSRAETIITEYENDPVIRAYLDQQENWQDRLMELKSGMRELLKK